MTVGAHLKKPITWIRGALSHVGEWWTDALAPTPVPQEQRDRLVRAAKSKIGTAPKAAAEGAQFFDLYKLMVESSEKLVARRQGVNTFFLTINGLLMTAIGLFVQADGRLNLQAGGVAIISVVGLFMCQAWRSLLISFGQLNTGKFVVITQMERQLAASIYAAEWEALDGGNDPLVYRSFTTREADVPVFFGIVYFFTIVIGVVIWLGVWSP